MYMGKYGAVALILAVSAGSASAATYNASRVIEDETTYGQCAAGSKCTADNRKVTTNSLGEADAKFYSLGLGGTLTLAFDKAVFGPGAEVMIQEVTFGGPTKNRHFEALDVYSVMNGAAKFVTTIYNTMATNSFQIADSFQFLKLVDVTKREFASTTSFDGYDVDSVSVSIAPVPVPAAGGLLLAGLAGLGLIKRRRKIV